MTETEWQLFAHVETLFPVCRSITGDGLRQTLQYIKDFVPLMITEVASGTPVLDWTVPPEWLVRHAQITTLDGVSVVNFERNNLHLMQYSEGVNAVLSREDLDKHLHSLPGQPDLVPYRTSYYARTWGFCLSHRARELLAEPAYRVVIDTTIRPGIMNYGELLLPGETDDEVLISAHCCHPSLANDNLSGIAVAIELARYLQMRHRRLSYRFLFAPGTIGAIAWLHFNRQTVSKIRHGLVLACLGDDGRPSYKKSRRGTALIDRYMEHILHSEGHGDRVLPFEPIGYDERQFCSPGFNLPVGCFSRSPAGTFPEYHTSADNLDFVKPSALSDSLRLVKRVVDIIENDEKWRNLSPYGEPRFGPRGLYATPDSSGNAGGFDQMALMWVLNLSDGNHSLFDIAERSGKAIPSILAAAQRLREAGLLERVEPNL